LHEYTGNYVCVLPLKNVKRRCYLVRLIVFVNYEPKFNCDDIAIHIYAFRCSVLLPPPSSKYFGTCVLNTFFGWVLVLVLKILLKSILPITVYVHNLTSK